MKICLLKLSTYLILMSIILLSANQSYGFSPGQTRTHKKEFRCRVHDTRTPMHVEVRHEPAPGWQVSNVEMRQIDPRFGSTSGPSVNQYQRGSEILSENAVRSAYKSLMDLLGEASNLNTGQAQRIRANIRTEFDNRLQYYSQSYSANSAIVVQGSCQARWRDWPLLGFTEYTSGGKLFYDIYITEIYVGTNSSLDSLMRKYRNEIGRKSPPSDKGYGHLPKAWVDVNNDGRLDYCRFVGDAPNIFIACDVGASSQYAYQSVKGIDQGYGHMQRGFKDMNQDGYGDYCRCVGNPPNIFYSCNLGRSNGFDSNQYTKNYPGSYCRR